MSILRIRSTATLMGAALAIAACTTTYTEGELAKEEPEQATAATDEEKSALEYDKEVDEEGGDNAQSLEGEAEWNWESANE